MIRAAMIVAMPAALLAACAQDSRPAAGAGGGGALPGTQACIDQNAISSRRAEGPDSILFEMRGGMRYRNRLPGRCPGLASARDFGALAFEVQGGHLCRGDRVRVIDSPATASSAVSCPLGWFEPAGARD